MTKLPLKVRILEYAIEKDAPFTIDELVEKLGPEYKGERFANYHFMEKLVRLNTGVNTMEDSKVWYDENGELKAEYVITDFGKSYERLIPGHKKKNA